MKPLITWLSLFIACVVRGQNIDPIQTSIVDPLDTSALVLPVDQPFFRWQGIGCTIVTGSQPIDEYLQFQTSTDLMTWTPQVAFKMNVTNPQVEVPYFPCTAQQQFWRTVALTNLYQQ